MKLDDLAKMIPSQSILGEDERRDLALKIAKAVLEEVRRRVDPVSVNKLATNEIHGLLSELEAR